MTGERDLRLTADDFGLTRGVSETILEAVDGGMLNGVSLLANGPAKDYALVEYRKRADYLWLAVHLNLTEGLAVSAPALVTRLVDRQGFFRHSFASLWASYLFSTPASRRDIRRQIRNELASQVETVRQIVGPETVLRIDGHQHIHMLPFVFDQVLDICASHLISSIRIPAEPLFFAPPYSVYFGPNLVKHFLLNWLGRRGRRLIRVSNLKIKANDYLLGVLHSGQMTAVAVKRGLEKINRLARGQKEVEIIFHPGSLGAAEEKLREQFPASFHWSNSLWRVRERQMLKSGIVPWAE